MIELRCSDVSLLLKLGCESARTRKHLEEQRADEALIQVRNAECTAPLFWRWLLGRQERTETGRSAQRDHEPV
jgi:hypothetical protein